MQKPIITKVAKWGNGYGIRVPVALLEAQQLTEGTEVIVSLDGKGVSIVPHEPTLTDMSLAELLEQVTPEMLLADAVEHYFGKAVGREVW